MKIKIDQADRYFSLYIRNRDKWTCQRCKKKYEEGSQGLHCSHFWGRSNESTRFDPDNACSICFGCHNYFHANPEDHRNFVLKRLGEKRFIILEIKRNTYCKKDRKLQKIVWKTMLEKMKEGSIINI